VLRTIHTASVYMRAHLLARVPLKCSVITDRPKSFACIHNEVRAAMADPFAYGILFEFANDAVVITGIFHAASDQGRWFERSV